MDYAGAWDPRLSDVVVSLPNGSRFVFWRGSSYVPFWAGRCNTGLSYEWAETSPPADGYTDCVEPLMDKELRYGRVRIVESTSARVHVRWSYQSCDFKYKVWGDSAVEDYYFYPDGFGTRVLTLQSEPSGDYELCEFIILTPQATYPFDVLPPNLVDVLFLDGQNRELTFPFLPAEQGAKSQSRDVPAIYRVRLHKDEPLAAVCFNPRERKLPATIFPPFSDQGRIVTPTYWGSHWPLARGKTTGWAIDDRVRFTPCHNSVMSWARCRPEPVRTARLETLDTLGRSKPMIVQTWAWLIGMSDADDARLLRWAASFAKPPALELDGARLEAGSYVPERRAIRLIVESDAVTIGIKPDVACVNPVFELSGAAAKARGHPIGRTAAWARRLCLGRQDTLDQRDPDPSSIAATEIRPWFVGRSRPGMVTGATAWHCRAGLRPAYSPYTASTRSTASFWGPWTRGTGRWARAYSTAAASATSLSATRRSGGKGRSGRREDGLGHRGVVGGGLLCRHRRDQTQRA